MIVGNTHGIFEKIENFYAKPIDNHVIVCYYHIAVSRKEGRA